MPLVWAADSVVKHITPQKVTDCYSPCALCIRLDVNEASVCKVTSRNGNCSLVLLIID
jgi:hypothetical protein